MESEASEGSQSAAGAFVALVGWLTAIALLIAGMGSIVADFADWDLALGIGGSSIPLPKDRYIGFMLIVVGAVGLAVMHFGPRTIAFAKRHKIAVGFAAAVVVATLAIAGGKIIETLDGGPAVAAAAAGDTERLQSLFDAGEVQREDHGRMLAWAAQRGHVGAIELMVDHGVDPDATRDDGASAMRIACLHGTPEAVAALERAGATERCN